MTPNWTDRARTTLLALGVTVAAALIGPAMAHAGVAIATTADINPVGGARTVSLGERAVPAQISLIPRNTAAQDGLPLEILQIGIVTSCATNPVLNLNNPCPSYDPGLFASTATGTGSGACAGNSFTIGPPDVNGFQLVTPTTPPLIVADDAECLISFAVDVTKLPSIDLRTDLAGLQTGQLSTVSGVTTTAIVGGGFGASFISVLPASATPPPTTPPTTTPPETPKNPKPKKNLKPKTLTSRFFRCEKPEAPFTGRGVTRKAGSAEIKISDSGGACAGKTFTATVSGNKIDSVKFYIDNKLVENDTKAPFQIKIDTRDYEVGSHQLKTTVSFAKKK